MKGRVAYFNYYSIRFGSKSSKSGWNFLGFFVIFLNFWWSGSNQTSYLLFWTFTLILDVRQRLRTYLNVHMFARTFYQRSKFSISFIYVIIYLCQLYSFMYKNVHYCSFTFILDQLRSYNLWTFMKIFFKNVRGCSYKINVNVQFKFKIWK